MIRNQLHYILFICGIFLLSVFNSCTETDPKSLVPAIVFNSPSDITRNSAVISGTVSQSGNEKITSLLLRYGDTPDMKNNITLPARFGEVRDTLSQLTANTQYYYSLLVGNLSSKVQSETNSFTTQPNSKPLLGTLKLLSQGPLSVILEFNIIDDGGEALQKIGVYYQTKNGQEVNLPVTIGTDFTINVRIGNLSPSTTYTVQAYASNTSGESRSTSISFTTGTAFIVTSGGMLGELIGNDDKYTYTSIAVSGPLNGTDLRFLRDMTGKDIDNRDTNGKLNAIDLSDASIVSGGLSYNGSHYTSPDTLGYGVFKDCSHLQKLVLPDNLKALEENALINCSSLTSLQIPTSTAYVQPSLGCSSLSSITVLSTNTNFSSKDGVLYDKGYTKLIWFPLGKTGDFSIPSSVKSLIKGAFIGCKFKQIVLPDAVEIIPSSIFQDCTSLTSVTLGSSTDYLSDYCFSGCPLKQLYVKAKVPPVCVSNTFAGVDNIYSTCVLYVPSGSKSLYQTSSSWSKFETIKEF